MTLEKTILILAITLTILKIIDQTLDLIDRVYPYFFHLNLYDIFLLILPNLLS